MGVRLSSCGFSFSHTLEDRSLLLLPMSLFASFPSLSHRASLTDRDWRAGVLEDSWIVQGLVHQIKWERE